MDEPGPFPGLKDGPELLLKLNVEGARIWGNARIGLCLIDAHLKGISRSCNDIAERTDLHRDTVRRHLRQLEKVGRVDVERSGRHICYSANEEWAERSNEKLRAITRWVLENHDKPN